jgi:antitoxin (DNA-binding transcriptional repressor) of toxin-antitoxin stability system
VNWTEEQFAEYMARLRRGETVVISEDAAPVADVSEAFIEARMHQDSRRGRLAGAGGLIR